jgi:hypothetical protein
MGGNFYKEYCGMPVMKSAQHSLLLHEIITRHHLGLSVTDRLYEPHQGREFAKEMFNHYRRAIQNLRLMSRRK